MSEQPTLRQSSLRLFLSDHFARQEEDHRRLEDAFHQVQSTAGFYQSQYQRSQQIETAMRRGSAPTPSFQPDFDEGYLEAIRALVVQTVFSHWNISKEASSLSQINREVHAHIRELIHTGQWPRAWTVPGKRTVDRRVNETADSRFYPDGIPPCIAVKAGLYCPNPARFDAESRLELLRMIEEA